MLVGAGKEASAATSLQVCIILYLQPHLLCIPWFKFQMTSRELHWACSHFDKLWNPFQLFPDHPAYSIGAGSHCPDLQFLAWVLFYTTHDPEQQHSLTTVPPTMRPREDPAPWLPSSSIFHLHVAANLPVDAGLDYSIVLMETCLTPPNTHILSILPIPITLSSHISAFLQDLESSQCVKTPSVLIYLYSHLPLGHK